MIKMFKKMGRAVQRLHRDEQGAEGLEKILIIGAIVLPLLALLIVFRNEITIWVKQIFLDVQDDADAYVPDL